ncbi:hypothetical protein KSP35_19610 [Aquihabitans sp. G128]|uniref:hypothetical protein n=1 Tax=Aquihabitans sp. G128 TaxID=2849779 RepID=UPI001C2411BE|nr:hypothetical protein [Aquihabitans sp. G128]QXC60506.1 hypothetical protein KSP35_19610 [Aquihabitans sp. G128]
MADAPIVGERCTIDARDGTTTFRLWAALMDPTHLWGPKPTPDPGGVHVHCDGGSEIDDSFDTVLVQGPQGDVVVDAETARLCWLAEMLGRPIRAIDCTRCGGAQLDRQTAVHHSSLARTCSTCGHVVKTSDSAVANPLADAWERIGLPRPQPARVSIATLSIAARDYSVIALWPTSTEILSNEGELELGGVHVHAWDLEGEMIVDATLGTLTVDGIAIGTDAVRHEAARVALMH